MLDRFSGSMITVAIAGAAVSAGISVSITRTLAQAPVASATAPAAALKTPWGEPDLQGIWTDETETPFQRPAKYASHEFFTAAQRAELDEARAALAGKDKRAERGSAAFRNHPAVHARLPPRCMASPGTGPCMAIVTAARNGARRRTDARSSQSGAILRRGASNRRR